MISSSESLFILGLSIVLLLLGAFLSFIAKTSKQGDESTASKIEKILTGVQCAQCGFPGCSAYAEAVAWIYQLIVYFLRFRRAGKRQR